MVPALLDMNELPEICICLGSEGATNMISAIILRSATWLLSTTLGVP